MFCIFWHRGNNLVKAVWSVDQTVDGYPTHKQMPVERGAAAQHELTPFASIVIDLSFR
jgi:hypothetical protein